VKICSRAGCEKRAVARGLCNTHWKIWRKTVPDFVPAYGRSLRERFWNKVERRDPDECWPWLDGLTDGGYGTLFVSRRTIMAHRLAYELFIGPIPAGRELTHLCHDPTVCQLKSDCPHRSCVNPAHLALASQGAKCSIEECGGLVHGHGYCRKHYERWKKHGDPEKVLVFRPGGSVVERFWAHVESSGPDDCWSWKGYHRGTGYGHIWTGERLVAAHRFAYELLIGPIPAGMVIDHTCHNGTDCLGGPPCPHRRCVNPAHLEAVTQGENSLRGNNAKARGAWSATRTHCVNGHALTAENVIIVIHRRCRACANSRKREHRARWAAKYAAASDGEPPPAS
jgi:hypothetical protein